MPTDKHERALRWGLRLMIGGGIATLVGLALLVVVAVVVLS